MMKKKAAPIDRPGSAKAKNTSGSPALPALGSDNDPRKVRQERRSTETAANDKTAPNEAAQKAMTTILTSDPSGKMVLVSDENTKHGVPINIVNRLKLSRSKPMPRYSRKKPIPATRKTGPIMFRISLVTIAQLAVSMPTVPLSARKRQRSNAGGSMNLQFSD